MKEKKEDIQSLYEFCNTVTTLSEKLLKDYNLYLSKHDEYKEVRAGLVEEGDREGIDQHDSVLRENEIKKEVILALFDLTSLVEKNPYPGKRLHILSVAHGLLPDVYIPGHYGKGAWLYAFHEIRLLTDRRVYFPAEGGIYTIEEIEERLYDSMGMEGYIPASVLEDILRTDTRTQLYRNTKESLTERGWAWASKRIDGKATKTMVPPTRTTHSS